MPSTNETEFYGLSQWVETDPFVRVDFNADNAKLDQELHRVEEMAQESYRSLPTLSYTVYNLILRNHYEGKYTGIRKGMVYDGFMTGGHYDQSTGAVVVRNNTLCLDGAGSTGSVSYMGIGVGQKWGRAYCWLRSDGKGTITVAVNGTNMTRVTADSVNNLQGVRCTEWTYRLSAPESSTVTVQLTLSCGTASTMTVYDYGVIFL